jgi:hypothetical protein
MAQYLSIRFRNSQSTIDKAYFRNRFLFGTKRWVALLAIPVVYATHFVVKTLGRDGALIEKDTPLITLSFMYICRQYLLPVCSLPPRRRRFFSRQEV